MHVKKGDTVTVITGKDKGKSGAVVRAIPKLDLVVVEGVNVRRKHQRATKGGQKGQVVEKTLPIHVSNVRRSADAPKKKAPPKKRAAKA